MIYKGYFFFCKQGISDDHNKYLNNNTNIFDNTHHLSIGDVLEHAEIENLTGSKYKNYKSALEIMVQAKSIKVCGQNISQAEVHKRLENISYEHLAYVDNNMPRSMRNGKPEIQVINPAPYIISSLYNALQFTESELINLQDGTMKEYRNSA